MTDRISDSGIKFADSDFLPVLSRPQGSTAESIRTLRTHLVAQHVRLGRRAFAICAADENAGCSFVAANLAIAFSQSGANTMLIDSDLRYPSLDKEFRRSAKQGGLQQCLNSPGADFSEFFDRNVLPKLTLFFAGGAAANPQDLLSREGFEKLMDFCTRSFDVTIVNAPPASVGADVIRVGSVVSFCLVVARRDLSLFGDVKALANQLKVDGAQVLGTVLIDH